MSDRYHFFEENGAKAAVWPIKNVETVACSVVVNGGYYYGDIPSLAHLIEHLTGQSTKNFSSYQKIENYKEHYGIGDNASVGGTKLKYWFVFPKRYLNEGFKLIEEIIFEPRFKQELIEKEILVLKQEAFDFWDNPYRRFKDKLTQNMAGKKHVVCRTPFDKLDDLADIKKEDLESFHRQFYYPKNTYWAIAGDVSLRRAKRLLSEILDRPNYKKSKLERESPRPKRKILTYKDDVDQPSITFNWFLPERRSLSYRDFHIVDDARYILVSNRRSLLYSRLRRELSLIYGISFSFYHVPGFSWLQIRTSTEFKNISPVCREVNKAITSLLKSGVSETRYEKIKHYRDLRTLMAFDSVKEIADILASQLSYPGRPYGPEEMNKICQSIKASEVEKVIRDYLNWDKVYLGFMAKNIDDIDEADFEL